MVIYNAFIYQTQSGILVWKKSFDYLIDNKKVELFSSFFSAIQSFIKQLMEEKSGQSLKNIEMGEYVINNTSIPHLGIDLIIIADKSDKRYLKDVADEIIELLHSHSEIIKNWNGDTGLLKVLDFEITHLLSERFSLLNERMLSREEQKRLEDLKKIKYTDEYNFLKNRYNKVQNLFEKRKILKQMTTVAEKLDDNHFIKQCQGMHKDLEEEIRNTKTKLEYYLKETKEFISNNLRKRQISNATLFDFGYRDAYINLYSFSKKLKLLGRLDLAEKYYKVSKLLIDKPAEIKSEFPSILKDLMNLPDNADEYIEKKTESEFSKEDVDEKKTKDLLGQVKLDLINNIEAQKYQFTPTISSAGEGFKKEVQKLKELPQEEKLSLLSKVRQVSDISQESEIEEAISFKIYKIFSSIAKAIGISLKGLKEYNKICNIITTIIFGDSLKGQAGLAGVKELGSQIVVGSKYSLILYTNSQQPYLIRKIVINREPLPKASICGREGEFNKINGSEGYEFPLTHSIRVKKGTQKIADIDIFGPASKKHEVQLVINGVMEMGGTRHNFYIQAGPYMIMRDASRKTMDQWVLTGLKFGLSHKEDSNLFETLSEITD